MGLRKYKLGQLIGLTDERNSMGRYSLEDVKGISTEKNFIETKANMDGVSLDSYKVVNYRDFAYVPDTSRRGDKIALAFNNNSRSVLISSIYITFKCNCLDLLLPEYLMMWFRRPEFDRYARFHSHGSAREIFDWDELCDVMLPIPSITRQREIVSEYETLTNRIHLNNQMIQHLEATAQALYRKTFVDNIDKENLPEGWKMGTLSELAIITMGQSPDGETYNLNGNGTIFYQGRTDFGRRFPAARVYTTSPTRFAKEGDVLLSVRAPVGDLNIAPHNCCIGRGLASLRCKINAQGYLYYQLQDLIDVFNVSDDEGTIFGSINKDDLYNIEIVIPKKEDISLFESQVSVIDGEIKLRDSETNKLTELQSLLLAKMGQ